MTMMESDDNVDGMVDSRATYTYDANGNMTMMESDDNVDGVVDSRTTNTWAWVQI
jgi:hypothetical protein